MNAVRVRFCAVCTLPEWAEGVGGPTDEPMETHDETWVGAGGHPFTLTRREQFREIRRFRRLDYCPTCAPERTQTETMLPVLAMRNRRWFTCACGAQWWMRRKTGEVKTKHILAPAPALQGANEKPV